ncbi:OLC1v1026404C1 [Oldenlandia corymbosa var. corymbosa]|uniref:OLC1v1026404C1 n=1 Tax=Oldenlandia corymbosa var. corymbosa TaxID=529605 RepID=A0AAV1C8A0_OLDCO|nr:OLC1v1026404C1 [Oldenlandia corymbosa var. corymbosa]
MGGSNLAYSDTTWQTSPMPPHPPNRKGGERERTILRKPPPRFDVIIGRFPSARRKRIGRNHAFELKYFQRQLRRSQIGVVSLKLYKTTKRHLSRAVADHRTIRCIPVIFCYFHT